MIDAALIQDLAHATGCARTLSAGEIKTIRQKLAYAYVDDILDKEAPDGEEKRSGMQADAAI
jgi:hypothetical protein